MSTSVVVHVGTNRFQGRAATAKVCYHGFADLPTERDSCAMSPSCVTSPQFACLRHMWRLEIYPGGDATSGDGMVGVYLHNQSKKEIKINCGYCVKDSNDSDVAVYRHGVQQYSILTSQQEP